ncbi:hypothetical protein NPIL_37921 [Nephila pilipes]|uniref:C2H2-type domain-containing protein n=1 Tax=Nephila pilipes TaxID=299642 RepID=A0A8X6J7S6_NEPPI|nr:hypothetical protein NPIL_37921 [Nephila pilipes]
MYSIQDRIENIIPNQRRLLETATENSPNSNMISSVSLDKHSERRKYNFDRNISIGLPNNATCASNSTVDDRLIIENQKLQMILKESVLKDISCEDSESHNRANSRASDDKPFKCRICGKGFTTRQCLKRHLINIHKLEESEWRKIIDSESLDITPFQCQICDTSYTTKQNLYRHLRNIHKFESNFK